MPVDLTRAALGLAAAALAGTYAASQLRYWRRWRRAPLTTPPPTTSQHRAASATAMSRDGAPPESWSIVIAARDEAAALPELLADLAALRTRAGDAPPPEVVVIDDHSGDATLAVAEASSARALSLPAGERGKKAALTYGIAASSGAWVATLDADTRVGPDWLAALRRASRGKVAVAGPVTLAPARGWWERFQALDFCGMMAITAATLHTGDFAMGNGANLAVRREVFDAVGGYAAPGGRESVSGDDMVLLGKVRARYPGRVGFAKSPSAAVRTPPHATIGGFVRQRWRWAAKTGLNRQPALTLALGAAWAFHVGLWLGIPLALAGRLDSRVLAGCWAAKALADYPLLRSATRFWGYPDLLDATYPLASVAHAAYVAGVGTLALLPVEFTWKGRRSRY